MAERISDVYEFNLKGNYQRELRSLQEALKAARAGFSDLAREVEASGVAFTQSRAEVAELKKIQRQLGDAYGEVLPAQEQLASSSLTLANAYNDLVREQNRLTQSRQKELLILERETAETEPKIIQMRAEAAALKKLNKELEKVSASREFERLAAQAGFKVSADRTRLFDAEAEAMRRAAKAAQELAVTDALRTKGLDARGKPLAQPTRLASGQLSAAGEQKAQAAAQARLDTIAIKERIKAILEENGVYLDKKKKTDDAKASMKTLNAEGEKSNGVFNRVSFTFRRLIGIMAAFTIARQVAGAFTTMVTEAITFNSTIEQSRVGIAGLVAAAAQVRDPISGKLLSVDDQILRAQDIAIDQMKKLRVDALQTAASYDELARAFQTAVAPGLQNNLTLDQIRKITVQISQAATGLGVAQDTLAEEIRSLFEGTISARNTRIATALGISNEDINRAKQAGQLFEFINQRFAAISKTGKLLMDTFTGQLSNATDAFKQLLAETSRPLFEQLKGALADIQKAIFKTVNDAVIFRPDALKAFKGLFDGLAAGVEGIRAAFQGVDVQGFADSLGAVGKSLGVTATVIAATLRSAFNIAAPFITAVNLLLTLFNKIATSILLSKNSTISLLGSVFVLAGKIALVKLAFDKIVASLIKMRAAWTAINVVIAAQTAGIGVFQVKLSLIGKSLLALRSFAVRAFLPLTVAVLALAVIDRMLSRVVDGFSILGKVGDLFSFLGDQIESLFGGLPGLAETALSPTQDTLATLISDFRELRGELSDLGNQYRQTAKITAATSRFFTRSIGTDATTTQMLQNMSAASEQFRQSTAKARLELAGQEQAVEKLRNTYTTVSTEQGALAAAFLKREGDLQKALKARAEVEKELADIRKDTRVDSPGLRGYNKGLANQQAEARGYSQLLKREKELREGLASVSASELENSIAIEKKQAEIAERLKIIAGLKRELAELERQAQAAALVQNGLLARQASFEISNANKLTQFDAAQAEAEAQAIVTQNSLLSDYLIKQSELARFDVQRLQSLKQLEKAQLEITDQIELAVTLQEQFGIPGLETSRGYLTQQLQALKEQGVEQNKLLDSQRKRLALDLELARLRKEGSGLQGIGFGLQQFAAANSSTFNIGEQFGLDLANGVSGFLGQSLAQSVAAAVDPNRNFDLAEAAANLAITLAAELATKLAARLISELLQSAGIDVLDTAKQQANATAAGAAFSAEATVSLTPAGGAAGAAFGTAATTPLTPAGTAGGTAFGAAAALAIDAAAAKAALKLGITTAATTTVKAQGGRATSGPFVRGFAGGGSHPRRARPLGVDGRDTIPAYLRAGEWVIRPESVRLYGDRFMQALNRGQLNPDALRSVAGSVPRSPVVKVSKRGFATGGPVVASQGAQAGAPVQVLQFYDEQSMDRALAAGPGSMVRFARQRRGAYRAALGLDGAP